MLKHGIYISNLPDGEEASGRELTAAQQLELLSALERELTSFLEGAAWNCEARSPATRYSIENGSLRAVHEPNDTRVSSPVL